MAINPIFLPLLQSPTPTSWLSDAYMFPSSLQLKYFLLKELLFSVMTHVDVMQFDDLALHRIQGLRLSLKKRNNAELFSAIGFVPDTVRMIGPFWRTVVK